MIGCYESFGFGSWEIPRNALQKENVMGRSMNYSVLHLLNLRYHCFEHHFADTLGVFIQSRFLCTQTLILLGISTMTLI